MKEYKLYIFDFDGTIADTVPGIINSAKYALDFYGIEEKDEKRLDYFIGPPLFDSFKTLYNVSDEMADKLIVKYRERYKIKASEESSVYDGVEEMLKELKKKGKKIAVASSKPLLFVEDISKHHGIYDYFDYISAETFANTHSRKAELITDVLEHFGITDKSEAIMTGDRFYDIEGAVATGIDSAGALYGFGTEKELKEAGATYLLDTPAQLCDF